MLTSWMKQNSSSEHNDPHNAFCACSVATNSCERWKHALSKRVGSSTCCSLVCIWRGPISLSVFYYDAIAGQHRSIVASLYKIEKLSVVVG